MNSFINLSSNDSLLKMKYCDKEELLRKLKDYYISFRDKLNLNYLLTFGVELEFQSDDPKDIESGLKIFNYKWLLDQRLNDNYWEFKRELSSTNGYEITSPILIDNEESFLQLKAMCNMIEKNNGTVSEKDAAHIHFGPQLIGNDIESWIKFFRIYSLYETIIYRFSYGEFECGRSYIEKYAFPVARTYNNTLDKLDIDISLKKLFLSLQTAHKTKAIQFFKMINGGTSYEKDRSFEFRMPNGTLNPVIWQNNINMFAHLIMSAKKDIDMDLIMKRINDRSSRFSDLRYYNDINVDEALEFADLIFDNNLDKINFLRQYMKDFITSNRFEKAKSFTK